jgi:hypothetical protein
MKKAAEREYGTAEVCAAAGLARGVFDAWLLRKYLPLPPGPGTGRTRTYTRLDAVRIAVVAELTRLGIGIGVAAEAADFTRRLVDEDGQSFSLDEPGWTLILTPSSVSPPDDRRWPHPQALVKDYSPERLHSFIQAHFSEPSSFAFLDISKIAREVTERLGAGVRTESSWDDAPTGEKISVVIEDPSDAGHPAPTGPAKKRRKVTR